MLSNKQPNNAGPNWHLYDNFVFYGMRVDYFDNNYQYRSVEDGEIIHFFGVIGELKSGGDDLIFVVDDPDEANLRCEMMNAELSKTSIKH